MLNKPITRRTLLQSAAVGAVAGAWELSGRQIAAAETRCALKILDPIHGAVLNHRHGKQTGEGLTIRVSGECRPGDRVTVNGTNCRIVGNRFDGECVLRNLETDVTAVGEGGGDRSESRVRVVWDRYSVPRYHFVTDDNIFFLRDIAQKNYASLFDSFYLKGLRDLNRKYGTKFVLNIYYAASAVGALPSEKDFRISQFPDRYKGEWRDNGHWLKLAFHAYADKPANPYANANTLEKLLADFDLVAAEIHRFAGAEAYALPCGIHWGMTPRAAFKPLYDRGVRVLGGVFDKANRLAHGYNLPDVNDPNIGWAVNYNWDGAHTELIRKHRIWKDFESGIIFKRGNLTCNATSVADTASALEASIKDPRVAEIIGMVTHEQYFWPFFPRYLPDHFQRMEAAIRWVTERAYKPVFLHEGLLGSRV